MRTKILNTLCSLFTLVIFAQSQTFSTLEISIPTNTTNINGTLITSSNTNTNSLVILIPGSGPTNRNGNSTQANNNSLRFLAESLSENGIPSFRYDKSVLSYSDEQKANLDTLTFNTFIYEAKQVVNHFKNQNTYSKIIIAGHSQGSLVGMLASHKHVDAFISLEGAARSIDEVLVEQIEKQAPFLKDETKRITDELKKGNTVEEMTPLLNSIFKKSIQPFLISWMQYNPQEEIQKLTIPVLIVNGTKDIQVPVKDAELLKKAAKSAELKIIDNMNHIFKTIEGDANENIISYSNPSLPIHKELTNVLVNFIKNLK